MLCCLFVEIITTINVTCLLYSTVLLLHHNASELHDRCITALHYGRTFCSVKCRKEKLLGGSCHFALLCRLPPAWKVRAILGLLDELSLCLCKISTILYFRWASMCMSDTRSYFDTIEKCSSVYSPLQDVQILCVSCNNQPFPSIYIFPFLLSFFFLSVCYLSWLVLPILILTYHLEVWF